VRTVVRRSTESRQPAHHGESAATGGVRLARPSPFRKPPDPYRLLEDRPRT
jgi:hypothetical protein